MELKRRKFQGVLNILSFNRHFYVFGGIALLLIIAKPIKVPVKAQNIQHPLEFSEL